MKRVDISDMVIGEPYLIYFHDHVEIAIGVYQGDGDNDHLGKGIFFKVNYRIIRGDYVDNEHFYEYSEVDGEDVLDEDYAPPDEIFHLTSHEYYVSIIDTI